MLQAYVSCRDTELKGEMTAANKAAAAATATRHGPQMPSVSQTATKSHAVSQSNCAAVFKPLLCADSVCVSSSGRVQQSHYGALALLMWQDEH